MCVRANILSAVRGLALCEFDWDGSGGLPIREDVRTTALAIFDQPQGYPPVLSDYVIENCPTPSVTLNCNGTIEVAMQEEEGRGLLLTFQCGGVISYVKVYEDEQTTIEGVVRLCVDKPSLDDYAEFTELLDWLAQE